MIFRLRRRERESESERGEEAVVAKGRISQGGEVGGRESGGESVWCGV